MQYGDGDTSKRATQCVTVDHCNMLKDNCPEIFQEYYMGYCYGST